VLDEALRLFNPTAQEIERWGFTVEEFQRLVQRKLDLALEEAHLREQITNKPSLPLDHWRKTSILSTQNELFQRRVDPRTHTVARFRELGMNTRALQQAERQLTASQELVIANLRRTLKVIQDAKAPTLQVVPPEQQPSQGPPRRSGPTPDMEVVEPRSLGNVPPGEQPPFNQQQTGRGTATVGNASTSSRSGQSPATGREPVQPNPNYQGPPALDDPGLRGTVRPLDKPPAPKPPTTTETIAPTITLVLANLEGILRCREADVPARDCLLGLMVGNGIAATMPLATQLLSAATLVKLSIGGQMLLIGKGAWDTYQFLDGLQGAARAEYEAWLAKRNRDDWLRRNMEIRDMPGYIAQLRRRIDDILAPLAANMKALCADLARMAAAAAPATENVAVAIREMPEKSAFLAMEPYHDQSLDALANERVLRRDLEDLRQSFAALGGDAARIAAFRQSAEGLAGRARTHMAMEDELAAAKGTLDRAFALMARMRNLSAGAVPYERLEALGQGIQQTRASRAGQADRLRIEVQALKRAFPKQEIEPAMMAELLSLDAAIDSHLHQDCNPSDMIAAHRQGAGPATETLLEAQNRLEPVDLLHASLSRLGYGTGREVLDAVQGMLQRLQTEHVATPAVPEGQTADATGGFQDEGGSVRPGHHGQTPSEQPQLADSGFTSEGGEVREGNDGAPHQTTQSGEGGFISEGTVIGTDDISLLDTPPSPAPPTQQPPPARQPPPETVTYFVRPWLPQSWKTSGDGQQTRAHIYQAGSRLGWAAGLAEYTEAVSDPLIIDHLNATAGHLQSANQYSFAPHKAWPDWQRRQTVYSQWTRRLTQGSAGSREYFRKGLDGLIRTETRTLRDQLETQAPHQAGTLANCDSLLFQIGFDLAHAAQLQSIALDGMQAGQGKDWARKLWNKASSSAASASRNMQQIKPTFQQKGCPDYTPLTQELNRVKSRLPNAGQPELHSVWSQGLALIASGGGASYDPDDLAGEWVIASDPSLSWNNYIKRKEGSNVDPNSSSSVRVRFEGRGGEYVGTITRQGMVPMVSDAWTFETTGQNRVQVFRKGLEYLRLKKTGKNLFEGTILGVGTPGDNRLSPQPIHIVVYDEAAKLLRHLSNMPMAVFTKENSQGILMLRLGTGIQAGSPDMEEVGRHVFAGMESEVPPGARISFKGATLRQIGGTTAPSYGFNHQKTFRFQFSSSTLPGSHSTLHYVGKAKNRGLDSCPLSDSLKLLQNQALQRHKGVGRLCMDTHRHQTEPINYTLLSTLIWSRGDWVIRIWTHDYPNHPGTQFGGQQGQINYMFRLLDKLVARLDTLPANALQDGSSPDAAASLPGIEAR
jgi:hypothetical protein